MDIFGMKRWIREVGELNCELREIAVHVSLKQGRQLLLHLLLQHHKHHCAGGECVHQSVLGATHGNRGEVYTFSAVNIVMPVFYDILATAGCHAVNEVGRQRATLK